MTACSYATSRGRGVPGDMADVLPPDWMCPPCQWAKHDLCLGRFVFCCCLTELLIEAEESDGLD